LSKDKITPNKEKEDQNLFLKQSEEKKVPFNG